MDRIGTPKERRDQLTGPLLGQSKSEDRHPSVLQISALHVEPDYSAVPEREEMGGSSKMGIT